MHNPEIKPQLEISLFTRDSFVARFMDEVGYLEFRTTLKNDLPGCSYGKMWILSGLSWGYRIRVLNEVKRFSNMYDVAKFVFEKTWNAKYYETNSDAISNINKQVADEKRRNKKLKKEELAKAKEEQSLLLQSKAKARTARNESILSVAEPL